MSLRKKAKIIWAIVAIALFVVGTTGGYLTGYRIGYEKGYEEGLAAVVPIKPIAVRVGIVADLTGKFSKEGIDIWRAAQLAAKEINEAGGVWLKEFGTYGILDLYVGDTESTKEGGIRALEKLILVDKVDFLVGGYSSAIVLACSPVAVEHKVPWIVTGAVSPLVTRRTDIDTSWIFHHIAVAPIMGRNTIFWAHDHLRPALIEKFKLPADYKLKVAIMHVDDPFGKDTAAGAIEAVPKENLAIELVAVEKFPPPTTMFIELLTKIKATDPDLLLVIAHIVHNIAIWPQARRDVGLTCFIVTTENNDDAAFYTGIGEWGDYMFLQSRWSTYTVPRGPTHERCIAFKEAYKKMWGEYPGMMGAVTYEGVYILAEALKMAGTIDRAKVVKALGELEMPEICQLVEGGKIFFTKDYREVPIRHFVQQLYYDPAIKETRPVVIWPADVMEPDAKIIIPAWFRPPKPG